MGDRRTTRNTSPGTSLSGTDASHATPTLNAKTGGAPTRRLASIIRNKLLRRPSALEDAPSEPTSTSPSSMPPPYDAKKVAATGPANLASPQKQPPKRPSTSLSQEPEPKAPGPTDAPKKKQTIEERKERARRWDAEQKCLQNATKAKREAVAKMVENTVTEKIPAKKTVTSKDAEHLVRSIDNYWVNRRDTVEREAAMSYDSYCRCNATEAEKRADEVLLRLKKSDWVTLGETERKGYGNQMHHAFPGDHFLSNKPLIEKSKVYALAHAMPKGAHLHIHFNSCLLPNVLLQVAAGMDRMFIMSSLPLVFKNGVSEADRNENFFLCEIRFSILSPEKENNGDIFDKEYTAWQTMRFKKFLKKFPRALGDPMAWLASKLVFSEGETYDPLQTSGGAWERFNARTRMMKGLFNYQTAYKKYTELFIKDLIDDNIQYAEIRPNFMTTNQLWDDLGTRQSSNREIVKLIIDECDKFKASHANFDGVKIIYCTPRSFPPDQVKECLMECIEFKKDWPEYIAGVDLVGEEAKGFQLVKFAKVILEFKDICEAEKLDIPLLLHCGETLGVGTPIDRNLVDAMLLDAKRIGHGYALPRHPHVLDMMQHKKICIEACPISNEVLGLTPRIGGHAIYSLLARNIPCTINSDNGTIFQSRLSHDFYQVLVGQFDMGLFGWRQLAEWSLEFACLDDRVEGGKTKSERMVARERWLASWRQFVIDILEEHDGDRPETKKLLEALKLDKTKAANESSNDDVKRQEKIDTHYMQKYLDNVDAEPGYDLLVHQMQP